MKHRISWCSDAASRITDKEKPPKRNPGGQREPIGWASAFDRVAPLPVLGLGGRDCQAHLLAQNTGDKSSDRVSLPAGGFHEILPGGATGALQQVKELGGFAAVAGTSGLLGRLGRLGRLRACVGLLRRGSLCGRLTLGRRDVAPVCGNTRPFGGSRLPGWGTGLAVGGFFWNSVHTFS